MTPETHDTRTFDLTNTPAKRTFILFAAKFGLRIRQGQVNSCDMIL
jgi:hypothetical protein